MALALGAAYRRGVASAITSLVAFAALILDWAHRAWPPLDWADWLSPFRYFSPYELVAGKPLQVENLLVLWAIAATGYTVAYLVISQRDISRSRPATNPCRHPETTPSPHRSLPVVPPYGQRRYYGEATVWPR